MVAVKAHQADAYLRKPDPNIAAFLFYGSDLGLVTERARNLASNLAASDQPDGEIIRLDDFDLEQAPDRLTVELGTVPMFGGRKIVHVSLGRRINAAALKAILGGGPLAATLIVEAGNLKPSDAARKLFEKSEHTAAVACFPDAERDLDTLITEVLGQHGLRIDRQIRAILVSRLGADRALSRGELEKLALFAAGKNEIELSDVDAIIRDATELTLDRIANASASGNCAEALAQLSRALAAGERPPGIISVITRHFHRLHRVRVDLDAGQPIESGLRKLRPPLHFKQRDAFCAQVRRWDRRRLDRALLIINEAAASTRLNSALEQTLSERLLLRLASIAAR